MFKQRRQIPAFVVSLALHLGILIPLAFIHAQGKLDDLKVAIETVFSEDRPPEEFTKELNVDKVVAETMNVTAGAAVVSNAVSGGTGAPAVAQQKIETSEQFKDPQVVVNVGQMTVPGLDTIGDDLGESEVIGDVTAVVEGYGAALGRITQEILRMMREDKVLVVWLFDESESMKDDQAEIREQFHKVYQELGIAQEKDTHLKNAGKDILVTAIFSYGKDVHQHTSKQFTADIPEVRAAIDKIGIDESGKENMCGALGQLLDKYRPIAQKSKRKLAFIIVSDESGDDGQLVDDVVAKAKRAKAPVFVLGREAVFGFPYARIRWKDPQYGLDHWLQINRGPETPFPEALQFDGFHARWDAQNSGFGPYEQARLAKETGGVFFVLPNEEENLTVRDAIDKRKFAFLDLKEYVPSLAPRREYEETRAKSKFRSAVWDQIKILNPYLDAELSVQEIHYPVVKAEFQKSGQANFNKALRTMGLLNQAAQALEKVKPLRDKEDSQRWRANYDLVLAQTMAYRVRLFQFLLALDKHSKDFPPLKDPKSNVWNVGRVQEMLIPDAAQIKATKVDVAELKKQEQTARELYEFVMKTHPRTPWAARAEFELRYGFGEKFYEGFHDPRYKSLNIKTPSF